MTSRARPPRGDDPEAARRRPRVLFVVTLAEVGGVASYSAQLLPGLVEDFDVTVAASGDGPLRESAESLGIPYVALRHMRRDLSPARDVAAVAELYRLMRRRRIDIVHAHSSKAGILARTAAFLARVPVRLFTVHGWAFAAYTGSASRAFRIAERAVRPLTTTIISPSHHVRELGIDAGTCDPVRSVVIPNAVDVSSYPSRVGRDGPPRLLSVGRLAHPKDFSTLIRAVGTIREIPSLTRIAGDGPDREALGHEIRDLGLDDRLELMGTRSDVPQLLGESEIFVLSSASECLPMSIIEAMAAGLPVVASDVGGVGELVLHERTGLLVPPGDAVALGVALARLLDDTDLRERLGRESARRAREHFDVPLLRERHARLYLDALAGQTPSVT